MRNARRRVLFWGSFLALTLTGGLFLWGPADAHLRAVGVLLRFEGAEGGLADLGRHVVRVRDAEVAFRGRSLRARRYRPVDRDDAPGLVLVHGVHPDGIDEPRLDTFARVMASAGVDVLTPQIPSLTRFELSAEAIEQIGAAARVHAGHTSRSTAGVMGISFGGGLALVAATEERHARHMAFVLAAGAHHDLTRVCRWYLGDAVTGPDGETPPVPPDPYGGGVLAHMLLDGLVSRPAVPVARSALARALSGDLAGAEREVEVLSGEEARLVRSLVRREPSSETRERVRRLLEARRDDLARLSPRGTLKELRVPVLLVHGVADPIIPSTETFWLAHEVPEAKLKAAVVTPFLRHAEQAASPTWQERFDLVHLMALALMALAEAPPSAHPN